MAGTLCTVLQATDNISDICSKPPVRNQPRIAAIVGDLVTEYFIICEQKVFCKVLSLKMALFIVFSCYYCFNLEYPGAAKWIFVFFQDYILEQPDHTKKSATYLSITSDIKRKFVDL